METIFFFLGSLSGAIGVALGAFGAHALRARLSQERQATFETGVRYQMFHAVGLLAAGTASWLWPDSILPATAGWLFLTGTLLFSGSLFLLVLTSRRWWGAITPLGGLAWIAGWVCLAMAPLIG